MKRIGILTAGGDTPALNATLFGAVERANQLNIEVYGILQGYTGLIDRKTPYVHLNPLFSTIPELQSTVGGTLLGSSRTYIDQHSDCLEDVRRNISKLGIDALICIGGDGTINGMQPISEFIPCVLAPKTIDNDLGLNYLDEPNEWVGHAVNDSGDKRIHLERHHDTIRLDEVVNYATPGYATAVFVVAQGVQRIRTTAESHRRIAIIEVMGRKSGYIALGSAYGQPDIILIPEVPIALDRLADRVRALYALQQNVVIVAGEGIVDETGAPLGGNRIDQAGDILYQGAAEQLSAMLAERLGDEMLREVRKFESPASAYFARRVGHSQRGGRPVQFDRFYACQLGGKAVDLLQAGASNQIAILQWSQESGFYLDSISANKLRDRWGEIHARVLHPSMYDAERFQPSVTGVEYLKPIFTNAIGSDDTEWLRTELFAPGNLAHRYQSINMDVQKRVRFTS